MATARNWRHSCGGQSSKPVLAAVRPLAPGTLHPSCLHWCPATCTLQVTVGAILVLVEYTWQPAVVATTAAAWLLLTIRGCSWQLWKAALLLLRGGCGAAVHPQGSLSVGSVAPGWRVLASLTGPPHACVAWPCRVRWVV
jgi:hypothetical protein